MALRFLIKPLPSVMRSTTLSARSRPLAGGHFTGVDVMQRWFSSYPDHEVVVMPALSPTMEVGNLGKWKVEVGQEFAPGDVLCEVETDKATVDFEAQDEGVIAKHLVSEGQTDVACGAPIMIVVQDSAHVDAFKDYVLEASAAPAPAAEPAAIAEPATPAPPKEEPAAQKPAEVAPLVESVSTEPTSEPKVEEIPSPEPLLSEEGTPVLSSIRALPSTAGSPLFQRMLKEQQIYNSKFGSCLLEIPNPQSD